MAARTADAELHEMLASLQRESALAGGDSREDVLGMLKQVITEGIDASENMLPELERKMGGQKLVLRGSCPLNMKAVNTEMLESQIREGKLQRPPFTQIFIKASDGSLDMCVPLGVDVRSGSKASEATAAVIGRGIVNAMAANPSVTFSMKCSQWSGSREACTTQSTTNCDWYSNGCYTHAFILEQKKDNLKKVEELLASLPAPKSGQDPSKERKAALERQAELQTEIANLTIQVQKDKREEGKASAST